MVITAAVYTKCFTIYIHSFVKEGVCKIITHFISNSDHILNCGCKTSQFALNANSLDQKLFFAVL